MGRDFATGYRDINVSCQRRWCCGRRKETGQGSCNLCGKAADVPRWA